MEVLTDFKDVKGERAVPQMLEKYKRAPSNMYRSKQQVRNVQ